MFTFYQFFTPKKRQQPFFVMDLGFTKANSNNLSKSDVVVMVVCSASHDDFCSTNTLLFFMQDVRLHILMLDYVLVLVLEI